VEEAVTLTFIWHAGDRAELLRKISEQYTRETGVRIAAILADCMSSTKDDWASGGVPSPAAHLSKGHP